MVSISSYKDEKGEIDWKAYRQAQIDQGDKCYKCETYISFGKGYRSLCHECMSLNNKEETSHSSYIRCPKCKTTWEPRDSDDFEFYTDGDHEVTCSECDHEFQITTYVSYTFHSPELIEEPKVEEDDEEEENE